MADRTETRGDDSGPTARSAKGVSERTELSRRAEALARRAAESKATIPHLYIGRRVPGVDADPAGLVAAAGAALRAVPELNASYRDGEIERHGRCNVGLVIELADEAFVPTILDADRKEPADIAEEVAALSVAAEADSLTAPALAGATFTVSVVEAADWIAAPIAPGQVGHLAAGAVDGDGDGVELTLSCDQRAVRPPTGARFLARVAEGLITADGA